MNRISRTFVSVALIAVLFVALAPAAQAFPLGRSQRSVQVSGGDWLDAALTWFGQLFNGEPAARQKPTPARTKASKPSDPTTQGVGGGPFTGSCIDPLGCGGTAGSGGV
ncbi:MAG TPA: hypothetical protein VKK31_26465 [Thermoanaerobaculia bacterium]|nr:hypothetical protein [Thermoanaerobaculia bacterium]